MVKKVPVFLMIAALIFGARGARGQDIFEAVKKGDLAAIRAVLERNPGAVNDADPYTMTPLHWAALEGRKDAAELLASGGADLDRRTRLGRTPFNVAVQHHHPDMANWLKAKGADTAPWVWPRITGDYVGEAPPGSVPRLFSPEILSSAIFDHGAPAFTRDGREVFWAVVFDDDTGVLMGMKKEGDAWAELKPLPFSEARFRDICPTLSADEKRLFFTSCRPSREGGKTGEYNMWVVDREAGGWTKPRLLAPEIASGKDARPVPAGDGTMYFGSWRDGSVDGTNIFLSKRAGREFGAPERLAAPFNASNAMPTYVAPDGNLIIFESFRPGGLGGNDFWLSLKEGAGAWGPAVNLGGPINSAGNDWFGGFSPDGKYFFFVSDRNGNNDIYWVDAGLIKALKSKAAPSAAGR